MRFTSGCFISSEGCFGQFGETCDRCQEAREMSPELRKEAEALTVGFAERCGEAFGNKLDEGLVNILRESLE